MTEMKIQRLPHHGQVPPLPEYQTDGAAAMDLRAFLEHPVTIPAGVRSLIPTGIAIELPPQCAGLVMARSGLANRVGLGLSNGVGLIDPDYRGEVLVALINQGDTPYTVQNGDRIAQLLVVPFVRPALRETELSGSTRQDGGFGSTGVR